MKIKNNFFKLSKKLALYRGENGEGESFVKNWELSKNSEEYLRKTVLDEIFYYESFPEDWEKWENRLGFTQDELKEMPFENFVVAIKDYFVVSIDYDVESYEPGSSYGDATPYSD